MLVDLFPKEAAEELMKVTDCECCGVNPSGVLYIVKIDYAVVFAHICAECIAHPDWNEVGESQYINKV
jgi:ribosome-binding protein aMBF1 (putative translation factor)